jgi:hypothetical protein
MPRSWTKRRGPALGHVVVYCVSSEVERVVDCVCAPLRVDKKASAVGSASECQHEELRKHEEQKRDGVGYG